MASAKFIEFGGKKILFIDIANADLETIVAVTKETKQLIIKEPLNSVLTITNVDGISVSFGTIRVLKDLAVSNKPYVKASAAIGLNSVQKVQLDIIMKFSGRNFPTFNTFNDAAEWLVSQSN